ncbi:NADPH-dependent FMN reductase [Phaeacidiphilus oryzae]|uniref:NADPH-dependent FMN reductase n=1 Tax=Phaeacidiphilus oryzae TaxID=348818 RepID=UPI002AFF4BB7|nr:NAD(P)H-dependent oxidoreductase [Phaeacidiphilus oryzae]
MTSALRLAILVSCSSTSRTGAAIADWFQRTAADASPFEVDRIDLSDWQLPPVPELSPAPPVRETAELLGARLDRADAFVVVTPEYNHSFPALLKIAIDWNHRQWQAKPVAFVTYGGRSGGIRAAEQLRQVFAELHAVSMRDGLSFHGPRDRFGPDGSPADAAGCRTAAKLMLDQLAWWARALADARARQPYAG